MLLFVGVCASVLYVEWEMLLGPQIPGWDPVSLEAHLSHACEHLWYRNEKRKRCKKRLRINGKMMSGEK
jgi:hypothetical protein